jgi:hypothetical protein
MSKEEILKAILIGDKTIKKYYRYPTGPGTTSDILFEFNYDDKELSVNSLLCINLIEAYMKLGARMDNNSRTDNKTAIELKIENLDFPIYFAQYDNRFFISTSVTPRGGAIVDFLAR